MRSAGGWGVLKHARRMKAHLKGDERILGDSDFVMQVLESAQEHPPGKHPHRVKARSVAAYLAVRRMGMDGTTVGKRMGVGQSTISRAVTRGEKLMAELEISFP
ncbi:hypothetical protein [Desulfosarcina ovata]|uniref:Chromosomal replication initiator DnaA C-terminal domain-containing protein n=1 Tax=Desulfosarcina ovata subsp. ovata TaxID=2752305 RepID=A0A5K8A8J5_9BACT|nr:hypothetical protein [Desulfosarcina ovata]BBO88952.1 hypothetical protein DSCOOX_21320 [Desulfosarcina ovata subsp. ovata]